MGDLVSSALGTPPDELDLHVGWPALSEVVGKLDGDLLRVLRAPEGPTMVNDVVIMDPADPRSVGDGAIVLGVGLCGSDADAAALVDRAGRNAAAAVVLRTEEVPARLLALAESLSLGVLVVPPEMPWGQAYSLLRTALVSAGARGEADTAGVPVGDLFALADAIAAAVRGPVTIEDPQWRVLAFSNLGHPIDEARRQTILGRGVPDVWARRLEEASVTQAIKSGRGVVRFDGGGAHAGLATRLAAPVRAGGELLGSIWVAEADSPLDADTEAALARAAQLAAIHLISHRAATDVKRRARGGYVRELLDGRLPAADAGPRSTGPFTVIGFEPATGSAPAVLVHPERVLSVMALYCEDFHVDAVCAQLEDRFWALIPTAAESRGRSVRELAAKIVDRVHQAMGVELTAGIGPSVPGVADVPRSRAGAQQALAVIERRPDAAPVVHIEDVRAYALLLELLEVAGEHPGWLVGKVQTLLEHDRDHGTGYAETLRAYLECWGDVAATARALGLHANTLRYRVRRLEQLSGLDLADPDERLVAELQVRLLVR